MPPGIFSSFILLRNRSFKHINSSSRLSYINNTIVTRPRQQTMDLTSRQICMPRKLAYGYIAIIFLTLLAVGVFEWLNAKRIIRLMGMLEEVQRNQVKEKENGEPIKNRVLINKKMAMAMQQTANTSSPSNSPLHYNVFSASI
ncbi:hypothetical protein SNOG_01049 [Parastagonospora nodorum SN15]|uniref:Uncharacterized protein n=1 Tax=Phaeosphaeria nodorum (strain SN15 / ATCC MYA-4574 / FGSC 10173) TaxID=321614 RepID=Q0V4L5_PHANO|nr:hypothetical protein SNOG_01049 [Parastagonospora nodorum SN15]EAT92544.1 hypothetical protein SNOG_01049 [Parastagonospora nodorum SN15]